MYYIELFRVILFILLLFCYYFGLYTHLSMD